MLMNKLHLKEHLYVFFATSLLLICLQCSHSLPTAVSPMRQSHRIKQHVFCFPSVKIKKESVANSEIYWHAWESVLPASLFPPPIWVLYFSNYYHIRPIDRQIASLLVPVYCFHSCSGSSLSQSVNSQTAASVFRQPSARSNRLLKTSWEQWGIILPCFVVLPYRESLAIFIFYDQHIFQKVC